MDKKIVLIYFVILFCLTLLIKNCKASNLELISLKKRVKNYIIKINPLLTEDQAKLISFCIFEESIYYNIPWIITLSIMEVESSFNPKAISHVGAKGLMQVYTLECCGMKANETKLFEIEYNISFGLCILRDKLKIANYNFKKAIRLYNGSGPDARKFVKMVLEVLNKLNREFYCVF